MTKKSLAIIGKGPSISRCKREYIDKYDRVAICGRPIFEEYEDKIGDRAHYEFLNCRDPRKYDLELINKIGLLWTINIHHNDCPRPSIDICPSHIKYDPNGRNLVHDFFKKEYDLDPSGGTIAIEYMIRSQKFNKIGLFGFDLMAVGEEAYYFPPNKVQQSLQYLYNDKRYSKDGINLEKCGHDTVKTFKYIIDTIRNNPDIHFEILSNREFPSFPNLSLI